MTTRLCLICAAPTAATRAGRFPRDEGLDPRGEAALARAIGPLAASIATAAARVVAPERRARDTAAALGGTFAGEGDLRDQDFGRWAGWTLAELAETEPGALAAWTADPAAAPHGGESLLAFHARVEGWLASRASAGGRVVAVTHLAVVRAAVATALGAGPAGFWRVEAPPLAVARLSHDGRRWALAALVPPP